MSPAVTGVTWKRRRMPCSRKMTRAALSPQKLPITARETTGPRKKRTPAGCALGEDAGVEKEKAERHDHAEEQKHFIAQRESNAHAGERGEVSQSRSLLPVISMKTSSREGVAISRLTSSLPWASRYFTRATMVCGGRWE